MAFPVDGVIQFTLNKMNERIRQHAEGAPVNEQSGLIFMGNVHDAVPRRLFLDSRLLWSSFFGHADQMVGLCTGGQLGGR
ncbi:hypothetical protein ACUTHT_28010, partial [Klebsiella pneumoniae]